MTSFKVSTSAGIKAIWINQNGEKVIQYANGEIVNLGR